MPTMCFTLNGSRAEECPKDRRGPSRSRLGLGRGGEVPREGSLTGGRAGHGGEGTGEGQPTGRPSATDRALRKEDPQGGRGAGERGSAREGEGPGKGRPIGTRARGRRGGERRPTWSSQGVWGGAGRPRERGLGGPAHKGPRARGRGARRGDSQGGREREGPDAGGGRGSTTPRGPTRGGEEPGWGLTPRGGHGRPTGNPRAGARARGGAAPGPGRGGAGTGEGYGRHDPPRD